jgi:hypothetical protein
MAKQKRKYDPAKYDPKKRKADYETNKEKYRSAWLKSVYGITLEQYDALLASQGTKCAICPATTPTGKGNGRWHIDHDHKTGKVRGILCGRCNLLLGHAADSIEVLDLAIKYLERHKDAKSDLE